MVHTKENFDFNRDERKIMKDLIQFNSSGIIPQVSIKEGHKILADYISFLHIRDIDPNYLKDRSYPLESLGSVRLDSL